MSAVDQHAEDDVPPRRSPDHGDSSACGCGGAWHEAQDHCVSWPCPGCTRLCPPEPGPGDIEDDEDQGVAQ